MSIRDKDRSELQLSGISVREIDARFDAINVQLIDGKWYLSLEVKNEENADRLRSKASEILMSVHFGGDEK